MVVLLFLLFLVVLWCRCFLPLAEVAVVLVLVVSVVVDELVCANESDPAIASAQTRVTKRFIDFLSDLKPHHLSYLTQPAVFTSSDSHLTYNEIGSD